MTAATNIVKTSNTKKIAIPRADSCNMTNNCCPSKSPLNALTNTNTKKMTTTEIAIAFNRFKNMVGFFNR